MGGEREGETPWELMFIKEKEDMVQKITHNTINNETRDTVEDTFRIERWRRKL